MKRLWKRVTSPRATIAVLVALGVLLTLNVVIPQAAIQGPEAVEQLASASPAWRLVLVTLGLGQLSTSPVFLATLAAFFLNLALVLIDRARATTLRLKFVPPTEPQLRSMTGSARALSSPLPAGFTAERAERVLSRLGYRTTRPGPGSVWGIRHRTAVLGFPLFHLSFFVLFAGGLSLYLTRFVTTVTAAEGQPFQTSGGQAVRSPPWGAPAPQQLVMEQAQVLLEQGRPVQLGATLKRLGAGDEPSQESWINHPAEWGALSVLVERAGIAPVLWLQDERGFTLDKVAVLAAGGAPARTVLGGGPLTVEVKPIPVGPGFPQRDALPTVPVELVVRDGEQTVWAGRLRPGEYARAGSRVLKLEEVRYWVFFRVVHEYGGLLLVVGFLMAVLGLVWRMWWFRREVGVYWDQRTLVLVCRVEYFPRHFRDELEAIRSFLVEAEEQAR